MVRINFESSFQVGNRLLIFPGGVEKKAVGIIKRCISRRLFGLKLDSSLISLFCVRKSFLVVIGECQILPSEVKVVSCPNTIKKAIKSALGFLSLTA